MNNTLLKLLFPILFLKFQCNNKNELFFDCNIYRYIFSLALADLLVIIICVPLASLLYTLESWPWGSALCRITECAKDISIGVSVFTLTALSAERYCAIVNPLRKLQVFQLFTHKCNCHLRNSSLVLLVLSIMDGWMAFNLIKFRMNLIWFSLI